MFKKLSTLTLTLFISLSLTACSGKYTSDISWMPEDLQQIHRDQLADFKSQLSGLEDGDPRETELLFNIGYKHEILGDLKTALKYYKKTLANQSLHYPALNNAAKIYRSVGEYTLSLDYFAKMKDVFPTSQQYITDLTDILIRLERFDDARSALEEYLLDAKEEQKDPNNALVSDLFNKIRDARAKISE